ncbi:MAG: hypothetical protein NZ518_09730, partial [Dehalococcoidia bacterium]|nr:hypothetical protein [Dehalococcoidia bacterium]
MADSRGLDQSEIDRLLAGLTEEASSSETTDSGEAAIDPIAFAIPGQRRPRSPQGRNIRLYDFKQPDKLSKDQLRTLEIVHANLARSISFTL